MLKAWDSVVITAVLGLAMAGGYYMRGDPAASEVKHYLYRNANIPPNPQIETEENGYNIMIKVHAGQWTFYTNIVRSLPPALVVTNYVDRIVLIRDLDPFIHPRSIPLPAFPGSWITTNNIPYTGPTNWQSLQLVLP
jgi:hypothetical protein